jgi:hypothetical protein
MYQNIELIARQRCEDRLREAAQERVARSIAKSDSPRNQMALMVFALKYRVMRLGLAK